MYTPGIESLLAAGKEKFMKSSEVLLRIANNILSNIDDEKYRSIRISSSAFQQKLLVHDGAINVLMEMGFQEDDDKFTLFMETNIKDLRDIYDQLVAARAEIPFFSQDLRHSQKEILARLKSHFQHSKFYESKSLQEKTRGLIPLANLNQQAQRKVSRRPSNDSSFQHCLLLELLAWFKRSFFTWTDAPKCTNCNSSEKPTSIGNLQPREEEAIWGAGRVEGYRCSSCSTVLRFPRYNNPEKLLETRTGRCGEWADCFTLICRSVGLEARHALDWTDHVWTEVYIPQWERWVHCDPCENVCDKPLMYEQGWKKKLSLIVAANIEEIVDVTWRYSVNRNQTLARRFAMFSEGWLLQTMKELNQKMSAPMTPARRKELADRSKREKEEFDKAANASDDQAYGGRTSGSLAWRQARGEIGKDQKEEKLQLTVYEPIELTEKELESCQFHLEYSSKDDQYTRVSNDNEKITGWDFLIWKMNDVMRKEEMDWEQAYLCRTEGSEKGYVCWKVCVPESHKVDKVSVRVESTTFETGVVKWLLTSNTSCDILQPGKLLTFSDKYKKSNSLTIHATLCGGEGDNAFQKGQLFRQSTSKPPQSPCFVFRLSLLKC